jgi:hypothetical protein
VSDRRALLGGDRRAWSRVSSFSKSLVRGEIAATTVGLWLTIILIPPREMLVFQLTMRDAR